MIRDKVLKKTKQIIIITMTMLLFCSCTPNISPVEKADNILAARVDYSSNRAKGEQKTEILENYEIVSENSFLSLQINKKSGSIIVFDKRTGKKWSSNPVSDSQSGVASAIQAQIKLTYQNSNGLMTVMDSYIECAKKNQIEYTIQEDGIKATYVFGTSGKDITEYPKKISDKRFQVYIAKLNENEQKEFKSRYSFISETASWVRRNLTAITQAKLIELFDKIGYTKADLDIDNMENNVPVEMNEKKLFIVPIIYKLTDDSLTLTIPMEEIVYPEYFPITKLELFEYFGALSANQDSYIFVPDGSGALINTSPVESGFPGYSAEVYGADETVALNEKRNMTQTALLPVFGISDKNSGFLAVIEDSDAIATIESNKSGSTNEYTTVYSTFNIIKAEKITLGDSLASSFYKFQNTPYQGNIKQRYIFLASDYTGYVGMAKAYREYLTNLNNVTKLSKEPITPFYLETIGTIDMIKNFYGIKYNGKEPLTTYEDNIELIKLLNENNISDIKLRLTGWMNGGIEQKIADRVNLQSVLGGKTGFEKLVSYIRDNSVEMYPQAMFNTLSITDTVLTRQQYSARTLNDKDARQYIYNEATNKIETSKTNNYRIIVSANKQFDLMNNFTDSLVGYYKEGLSIADSAKTSYSDFTDAKHYSKQSSVLLTTQAIKNISTKTDLMLYSPNARTCGLSDTFTGVPMSDSGYSITYDSVPFYQIVFHGYADYSFEGLNTMSDYRRAVLKCIEYGAAPSYKWVYQNNAKIKNSDFSYLYSTDYTRWLSDAVQDYKKIDSAIGSVRNMTITNHQKLADGIYETTYENKTSTIVNYNENQVKIKGILIEPYGFIVLKGEGA